MQLTSTLDQSIDADFYVIDGFDNAAAAVASLHAKGRKVGCYISAGSYENWRPDASSFPAAVLGNSNGWSGEKWLDIRRLDILGPIMEARLDMCRAKGFDAVDPDNVDGYTNRTGFSLTAADQLAYNRFLADAAHARGMAVGLKNDLDQIATLEPSFDGRAVLPVLRMRLDDAVRQGLQHRVQRQPRNVLSHGEEPGPADSAEEPRPRRLADGLLTR
jgi:hypothetical protein